MFDFEKFEAMIHAEKLDILYRLLDDTEQEAMFLALCGDAYLDELSIAATKLTIIEVEIDNRKKF